MRAAARSALLALAGCGSPQDLLTCSGVTEKPAFLDRRTVDREEACSRYEAALREKCRDGELTFQCADYFPAECRERQLETDVARCERDIHCARTCSDALDLTCGTTCTPPLWDEAWSLVPR